MLKSERESRKAASSLPFLLLLFCFSVFYLCLIYRDDNALLRAHSHQHDLPSIDVCIYTILACAHIKSPSTPARSPIYRCTYTILTSLCPCVEGIYHKKHINVTSASKHCQSIIRCGVEQLLAPWGPRVENIAFLDSDRQCFALKCKALIRLDRCHTFMKLPDLFLHAWA